MLIIAVTMLPRGDIGCPMLGRRRGTGPDPGRRAHQPRRAPATGPMSVLPLSLQGTAARSDDRVSAAACVTRDAAFLAPGGGCAGFALPCSTGERRLMMVAGADTPPGEKETARSRPWPRMGTMGTPGIAPRWIGGQATPHRAAYNEPAPHRRLVAPVFSFSPGGVCRPHSRRDGAGKGRADRGDKVSLRARG